MKCHTFKAGQIYRLRLDIGREDKTGIYVGKFVTMHAPHKSAPNGCTVYAFNGVTEKYIGDDYLLTALEILDAQLITFTEAEKKYLEMIGPDKCMQAYADHIRGNGARTIGEDFLGLHLSGNANYTKGGDCIINAGRKLAMPQQETEKPAAAPKTETPNPFAVLAKIAYQAKLF